MNKHLYRIVFNHALGLFQVVSELVRRTGRGASQSDGVATTATVRPVSLSLWVAFGWIGLASVATAGQIVTDPNAPGNQRPTVLGSPGAAPLINITTPSKAGVSRNTYNDFNVDSTGVVLNNSRTNTTTQLAGTVAGNPWLATGTAKVILNEVTGSNPSALNGYIEVAGDRAQVIIANPAGISCDGCGVINANRFTLTTGTPMLSGGALDSYRVTGGAIQIGDKGLDATRADYTDIIARAVQVNGGIWSPQLQVTTGTNQVSADQSQITAIAASSEKPTVALDVSALGGMYANKIVLLGTENGVGVRNAGTIGASADDLVVTTDGRLENTGSLQSQTNTQISASGGVTNAGTLSATRELTLTTPADVDNSNGTLNAARIAVDAASLRNAGGTIAQTGSQGITLDAGALSNRNGGRIGTTEPDSSTGGSTGTPSDGASGGTGAAAGGGGNTGSGSTAGGGDAPITPIAPLADGVLHITGLLDNDGGRINAAAGFDLASSTGVANDGGQLELRQLTLTGGNLSNQGGTLLIDGASTIHASEINNNAGQLTFAQAATIDAQSLSNRNGTFSLADTAPMTLSVSGLLDNTGGTLASNASQFTLTSGSLINEHGTINHAGADGFTLHTGDWRGANGTVVTASTATLTAGTIDHQGATLSATQLTLHAANLDSRGGVIATSGSDANTLIVSDTLDNSNGGAIEANGDLVIKATTFGNAAGTVQNAGTGTLSIDAATLNGNGGMLATNGTLTLTGTTIDLRNGTTVANAIALDTGTLTTAGGSLQAVGNSALSVRANGLWDNTGGTVATNGALAIQAGALDNTHGTLNAAGIGATQLRVAGTLTNTGGTLATMGATTVHAGALLNQGGTVQAAGAPPTITADDVLDNSQHGVLTSDGDLTVTATTLDNTQGTIAHAGDGALTINAATLDGQGGTLVSNGALTLSGQSTSLRDGTTSAQSIAIQTGTLTTAGGTLQALGGDPLVLNVQNALDNTGGTVVGNGVFALAAGSLLNQGGQLIAAGTSASNLRVAGLLDNTGGTLGTAGATTLHVGALDNTGGTIQAASGDVLNVTVDGQLTNDRGALQSNGDLTLAAGVLSNHAGTMQSQQDITANIAGTLDNTAGTVIAGGNLHVHAQTLLNRDTLNTDTSVPATGLYGQRVDLYATTVDNSQGQVQARDALTITGTTLTNAGGVLDGTGAVTLTGSTLDNTAGQVIQRGDSGALTLNVSQALTNTSGGLIGAEGTADIHAGSLDNSGGTAFARHALSVSTDSDLLNRAGGALQTNGALSLNAQGTLDNSGGTIDATDAAALKANVITNVGGQILAGSSDNPDAALNVTSASTLDNRGGTIGNRGGDLILTGASIDNSNSGTLVAQRDLNLDAIGVLNNTNGTAYATHNLSFQNGSATLDNTSGTLGAGDTTWLNLASITNTSGHIQADTVWLTTPTLTNEGGEVDGTSVHATLASLNGLGRLYGSDLLDAHFTGDYTHLAGQRLESDGVLSLAVDGTLTNQGTLQTAGELDLSAGNLINLSGGVINASNDAGTGVARIVASGTIDNQTGASMEGDTLTLNAHDITNTGNITGNTIRVDATTLTNGTDLGQATDNAAYQSGLIAATDSLALYISGSLLNRDATLYSQGDVIIAGNDSGARTQSVTNLSGDIEAGGNLALSTQQLSNARRVIETGTVMLSPADQAANSLTTTDPTYTHNDPLPEHQTPNIDPSQVLDAAAIAKANAYCEAHDRGTSASCVHFRTGDNTGLPSNYQRTTTDTLLSVTTITAASAESRLLSGGDMTLDGAIVNNASTIAAGRNLTINGQEGNVSTDTAQNIAWMPTGLIQATTDQQVQWQYLVTSPSRTWLLGDWWTYDSTSSSQSVLLQPGSMTSWITYSPGEELKASITAGGSLTINGGDITNTAVGRSGDGSAITVADVSGPGSTLLHDAHSAQAGAVSGMAGASGDTIHGARDTHSASAQTVGNATQALPNLVPPSNGIYSQNGNPSAPFLVNTAPRFAQGPVTSSDYLLRALGDDSSAIHKRLGDGYYEQNLVLDQILQLTGRRTLNGGDGLSQYTALMDDAANEASRLGLQLGAPLTTDQVAALSSDIVWLVDQVVDGQHVLVPVVYLSKATSDALHSDGALMAGNTVNIQSSGTVRNDGTITGTQGTAISADTLTNQGAIKSAGALAIATRNDTINAGTLSGGAVAVIAGRDLVSTGSVTSAGDMALVANRDLTIGVAPVQAAGNLSMVAGHDLTATASTIRAGGDAQLIAGNNLTLDATGRTTRTQSGQTVQENLAHSVTSVSAGGNLALVAGNDLTSHGAQLTAGNQLGLAAGHDMTLNAVTDSQSVTGKTAQGHTVTTTSTTDETVRGSTLSGANGVSLTANHDLTATSATIGSAHGAIGMLAGNDLTLNTAQENHSSVTDTKKNSGNVISNSSTRTHDSESDSLAIGTTVSGDSVTMAAGHDLTATAAQIVADHDIVMAAGNNLTLNTANDVHTEDHSTTKTKNGLMGAGVGVMVGQAKQSQDTTLTQTTPDGTMVGSLGGSVTMTAGNTVHLTNATVLSDTGTAIVGKNVTIDAALGTTDTTQTQKQSSSGLTLSLGGAAVNAAQGAYASAHRGSEVKDDRLKALYAAQTAYAVSDGVNALQNGAGNLSRNGTDGGVNLQLGIGGSSAKATTSTHDDTAYGSTIRSNGNVVIAATGGDLNVIGSQIGGDNVALAAANNINLLSQAENHTLTSENHNASGGVGVQIGTDGIGFYAQASVGKGDAHGNGTTHTDSSIDAKNTLTLVSGGDTTIQGAQAKGNTVLANIGGNLNIISEQDTDDYAGKQMQAGGKVVVGAGVSGSASYNQSKANSHYASVTDVSGISAGDGGFNIHVNGNTDLKGGVIVSAAEASKNTLDTGTLTFSNIDNKASAKASAMNLGGDSSMVSGSKYAAAKGIAGNLLGNSSDSDRRSSTTQAGIAQGTIITRNGDTPLDDLNRNPSVANQALKPVDIQTLQENVEFSQAAQSAGYQVGGHYTDEAYKTMFIKQVDVYEVVKDDEGNLLPGRKLTEEEKMNLQPGADGKVHIADNGIFNDAAAAEKYANQHSSADGPQYYAAFPEADNGFSELLVAGYQKNLENDFWGLTNATQETKLDMIQYGQHGLELDGHSRGSMTIGNAMESLARDGDQGILSGTTVSFFGPAYNATKADSLLSYLQNRGAVTDPTQQQNMVLSLQNHVTDPVGRIIGGNPSTGGSIPDGSSYLSEMWRAITGQKDTSHNCYGSPSGKSGCGDLWSDSEERKAVADPVNQTRRGSAK